MEKKLTAQGPNDRKSYTVTLPIEWIKSEKLNDSKVVNLDVIGTKIIISSSLDGNKSLSIDTDYYKNSLIKLLQSIYRGGFDEVKLIYSDPKYLERIVEIIDERLIGYEIVEQKNNFILIKYITKESSEDFKIVLRRIFLLLLQMLKSESFVQAKLIDKNIKKLSNYCQRILIKQGHIEFDKVPNYYLLLDRLEKIGDEIRWTLNFQFNDNLEIPEFEEIKLILRSAYELFFKFNKVDYDLNSDKVYFLARNIRKNINKMNTYMVHCYNLSRLLNSLYGDILLINLK